MVIIQRFSQEFQQIKVRAVVSEIVVAEVEDNSGGEFLVVLNQFLEKIDFAKVVFVYALLEIFNSDLCETISPRRVQTKLLCATSIRRTSFDVADFVKEERS